MNYIISGVTDIGIAKETNQDSLSVKIFHTPQGKMVLALMCDGMGGLQKGELASATVVRAFHNWGMKDLSQLTHQPLDEHLLRAQWESIVFTQNQTIMNYGKRVGIQLGTTVLAMLITEQKFYIMNVGDSRAYELQNEISQLTVDQTYVEREVALGNMTREQAAQDYRRNVLLQCCGASEIVRPDWIVGDTKANATYMLCSDGFCHEITSGEIYQRLNPEMSCHQSAMEQNMKELIALNKQRAERDNISVVLVRTF